MRRAFLSVILTLAACASPPITYSAMICPTPLRQAVLIVSPSNDPATVCSALGAVTGIEGGCTACAQWGAERICTVHVKPYDQVYPVVGWHEIGHVLGCEHGAP